MGLFSPLFCCWMAATLCTYGVIRKDYGIIVIFKLCVSQEAAVRPKQSTIVSLG